VGEQTLLLRNMEKDNVTSQEGIQLE